METHNIILWAITGFLLASLGYVLVKEFIDYLRRNIPKWSKTYRENEAQEWRLPERVRKWLDRLWLMLLGYMGCIIAIMAAMLTIPEEKSKRIGTEIFNQDAILHDDISLAVAVVLAPIGFMFMPLVVATYVELLVSIKRRWRSAKGRKERFVIALFIALMAIFLVIGILSIVDPIARQ